MRTLAVSLLAALALAPAARAAEVRIAIVDSSRAMNDNDEGKAIIGQINKDFEDKKKALAAKQKEFEALRDEFDKQSSLMNDQAKRDKMIDALMAARSLAEMPMLMAGAVLMVISFSCS